MGRADRHSSRLSIGELIDLEMRLRADAELPHDQLAQRDEQIGRAMGSDAISGRNFYRQWLAHVVPAPGPSIGRRVDQTLEMMSAGAILVGMIVGAGLVWGWLAVGSGKPVNVIHFWFVAVGIQLLLLTAFVLLVVLPAPWVGRLPGAQGAFMIGRALVSIIPATLGLIVTRLSAAHRQALDEAAGQLRKLGGIYGRLRTLLVVRLTQTFAVAFNVGAIASLVLAAYVTDPAFGWRSTRLDDQDVHNLAHLVAQPWAPFVNQPAPTSDQIAQTKFTQLEARFGPLPPDEDADEPKPWGAWWPFLVASLMTYGLLPRIAIWSVATWLMLSAVRQIPDNHPGLVQLRQRLARRPVLTTATEPDRDAQHPAVEPKGIMTHSRLMATAYHVVRWAGVDLTDEEIRLWLRERHRCEAASIRTIGEVDRRHDTEALAAVAADSNAAPLLLIVQAWEPPVGDYLDFLSEARRVLGPKRMIHVLLYQRGAGRRVRPPRPVEVRTWQGRVNTLGDAWITVEPMAEGAGT